MALVAYGSDSENETQLSDVDDEEIQTKNQNNTDGALFNRLPQPKSVNTLISGREEDDDEFLKKKEKPTELPPTAPKSQKQPAKIYLPSLSSFQDEEDDDKPRPMLKKPAKGSGLLNILPEPKSVKIIKKPATNFIPNILNKASIKPPINTQKIKKPTPPSKKCTTLVNDYDFSDDSDHSSDGEKSADFFSLNKNDVDESAIIPIEDVEINQQKPTITVIDSNVDVEESNDEIQIASSTEEHYDSNATNSQIRHDNAESDMDEAIRKLCSNRERRKGGAVQFIDINQSEILPDSREWLTKALTEDNSTRIPSNKRRGDEPSNQQKRKHQITYLAHQAKVNEQNLKNQWANNRLTRKQTQSKYGF